jgi:hypothetical protein
VEASQIIACVDKEIVLHQRKIKGAPIAQTPTKPESSCSQKLSYAQTEPHTPEQKQQLVDYMEQEITSAVLVGTKRPPPSRLISPPA